MIAVMGKEKDDSYPTRSSLIRRVRDTQDHRSWQEFYDIYGHLVLRFAIKAGLNEDDAEEVVQETLIAAAKHLPGFRYDAKVCSFKTWLLNMSNWRVQDHFRKRLATQARIEQLPGTSPDETRHSAPVERVPDPATDGLEGAWDQEWRAALLDGAIAQVKPRVDPKHWQAFDLYALKGWSVSEVVKALGITAAQVYLAKHRVAAALAKEIKSLEKRLERTASDMAKPNRPGNTNM